MRKLLLICCAAGLVSACGPAEETPATDSETDTAAEESAALDTVSGEEGEALVEGTNYNATSQIPCGFDNSAPEASCEAGVIRNWGEDGTTLVEVSKPDGRMRAIFFQGLEAYGADSAQSDGSAGWDFSASSDADGRITINYGPETYVIADAFVEGG